MNVMNRLNCSVSNCDNYKNGYCSLSNIQVSGLQEDSSDSVSCNNFVSRAENEGNRSRLECPYTNVQCNMTNCQNNFDGSCHADYVDMYNKTTDNLNDTGCHSFKLRI